jgi:hypothetical protein
MPFNTKERDVHGVGGDKAGDLVKWVKTALKLLSTFSVFYFSSSFVNFFLNASPNQIS